MLQQTRVAAVIPYYQRFLDRFPTIESLAAAPEEDLLKAWSGLGYYSRARNLQKAAIRMNGVFPSTYDEIRALPGVGEYTAAAVASIAFGLPHAAVDGNVVRVITRLRNGAQQCAADSRCASGSQTPGRFQSGNDGIGRDHLPASKSAMSALSGGRVLRSAFSRHTGSASSEKKTQADPNGTCAAGDTSRK